MKTPFFFVSIFLMLFLIVVVTNSCGQSSSKAIFEWPDPINITSAIDTVGVTELSGLHWNPDKKRLYVVADDGRLSVLQLNTAKKSFARIGSLSNLGSPEGLTQVDYATNEFYTIDEKHYEIRRFRHNPDYSMVELVHKWDLKAEPAAMANTGNDGPEGIVFVPDSYLSAVGFVSVETQDKYISTKGMGGLIFVAHQKKGFVWVFDVNPDKDDDYAFVGRYKTASDESCDLAFDRSTGLMYILHNSDDNSVEVTDLSTKQQSGKAKFVSQNEYKIPDPEGNVNIEGFAITPKFGDPNNVSVWLCRDVSVEESVDYQKDCLWWFKPIATEGSCVKNRNVGKLKK